MLLDEFFAAGNSAFLDELRAITDPRKIAGFADRWKSDPRPWARERIFDYLSEPLATPGHNVLVKRLFKHAEKQRDTELMAVFLHTFDCMVRRQRRLKWRWDSSTRQSWREEELYAPKDNLLPVKLRQVRNPMTGQVMSIPGRRLPKNGRLFSYRTRYYLRRRVWRYFRFLGYHAPLEYAAAIAPALARYTDEDLAKGEHILDSWCLLNICFRKHPALTFTPTHVRLQEGRTLNDLSPAPKLAEAWMLPSAADVLWHLLVAAQSRLVRVWTMALLKEHHQSFLATLTPEKLLPLFDSLDDEVQQFAAQALGKLPSLPTLPVTTWLRLLETRNPSALASICALMIRYVSIARLDLKQTVALATAVPAPVASLGLAFLKSRTIASADDRQLLSDLALSGCEAVAPANTAFALSILGAGDQYDVVLVSRFFDALLAPTRAAAWEWLSSGSAGYNDPALWARLLETPYEDTRLRLVQVLEERSQIPGGSVDQLAPIWTAVLLGIHRGGRHKIKALHQISRILIANPQDAQRLLPIMTVAIRSVRPAEARVGLAAVVHVVGHNPTLADLASQALPEMRFVSPGATS